MLSRLKSSSPPQPSSTAFGISQSELPAGTNLISVEGELDLSTAPRLKWMLVDSLEGPANRLVVDLSLTTFMDSTALGVLVGIKRSLDEDNQLAVVCARRNVLKIFEFAGIDGAFAIFPTLEEALAHVQGRDVRAG
jgi:anti-sigma B factor antagonist